HIGALDQVAERALGQTDRKPVAQAGHAPIAEPSADAQPIELLRRFYAPQPHIGAVEVDDFTEARGEGRMLRKTHRPDHADAILVRAAFCQHRDDRADRRLAAPGHSSLAGKTLCQRRMIDPLYEQRVALARREHPDRLDRHRPLREPLHRGAGAVRAVEHEMVALGFGQHLFDRGAAARHFGGAEARIFGFDYRLEPRRQRRPIAPDHALARAIASGFAARRSSTSLVSAMTSTLPVPSTGSLSNTQTSAGIIRSEACFDLAKLWKSDRVAPFCCASRMSRSPLRASGTATTADSAFGHSSDASASTAASEIISPPTLANRLARPLIARKPCSSMVTISPVSCQPSGGRSSTPGLSAFR